MIEGRSRSDTDLGIAEMENVNVKSKKNECLKLKISKHTSSEDLIQIQSKYTECLEAFRRSILHDPRSALQLFNFINEFMPYKARYGDVKSVHKYAIKQKWFQPMRRIKKQKKTKSKTEGSDASESE